MITLTRIDTGPQNDLPGTVSGGEVTFNINTSNRTSSEKQLEGGEVAVFLVEADISGLGPDANAGVSLEFDNLDGGDIVYSHD